MSDSFLAQGKPLASSSELVSSFVRRTQSSPSLISSLVILKSRWSEPQSSGCTWTHCSLELRFITINPSLLLRRAWFYSTEVVGQVCMSLQSEVKQIIWEKQEW